MLQGHESIHVRMQESPGNGPLGESIGPHVPGVEPEQVQQHKLVREFSEVLDMAQRRLLGRLLDKGG
jgi:hypothetical protein